MNGATADLRFLFTWSDGALDADWHSIFEPVGPDYDAERMLPIVRRYLKLRRWTPGWNRKSFTTNNHRRIDPEAITALLAEAARIPNLCPVCDDENRSTGRFCSDLCQQRSDRESAR